MDFTILNNFFLCNDILGQIFQLILAVFSLLFNIFGIIQHSVGAIFAGVIYIDLAQIFIQYRSGHFYPFSFLIAVLVDLLVLISFYIF